MSRCPRQALSRSGSCMSPWQLVKKQSGESSTFGTKLGWSWSKSGVKKRTHASSLNWLAPKCETCLAYVQFLFMYVCDVCIGERSIHPHLCVVIYAYNHRVSTQHSIYGVATPICCTMLHGSPPALTAAVNLAGIRGHSMQFQCISIKTTVIFCCHELSYSSIPFVICNTEYLWIVFFYIICSSFDQFMSTTAKLLQKMKKSSRCQHPSGGGYPLLVISRTG